MDTLKIYIDRLKDDEVETLNEVIDTDAFDIQEAELKLEKPVKLNGSAYCTKEHLVIDLKIKTSCCIPCCICNQIFSYPVNIESLILTIFLDDISGAIYDMTDEIRSAILLQIPSFYQCHNGKCPFRKELNQYFKQGDSLPFSDLTL